MFFPIQQSQAKMLSVIGMKWPSNENDIRWWNVDVNYVMCDEVSAASVTGAMLSTLYVANFFAEQPLD